MKLSANHLIIGHYFEFVHYISLCVNKVKYNASIQHAFMLSSTMYCTPYL